MLKPKARLFLQNMALKLNCNWRCAICSNWLNGIFGLIFGLVILLILAVFIAMVGFGTKGTVISLFTNREFRFAVGFTLQTSFLATMGAALAGIPCGYILACSQFRCKVLADLLLDLPIVLPSLISGVALLILFGPVLGAGLSKIGLNVVFSPL
jgi:molybdate transport system permease protein